MKRFFKSTWQKIVKNWVIIVICFVIVGGGYYSLFSHYGRFGFEGGNDFIYRMESNLLDIKMRLRGKKKASGKVGILAIDEKSIEAFGRWPFSRKYYAKALKNLKKLGVKWVGFDSIYAEPEKTYLEDARTDIKALDKLALDPKNFKSRIDKINGMLEQSPADQIFADGIRDFKNIVLGFFYFGSRFEAKYNLGDKPKFNLLDLMSVSEVAYELPEGRDLESFPYLKKVYGLVPNTPLISKAGEHFAFFSNDADADAINRWVVLVANIKGTLLPSLSLKTAAEYLNSDPLVYFGDGGIDTIFLINRDDDTKVIEVPIDPKGGGRILINHVGPSHSFHHYSLADAYHMRYTDEEKKNLKGSVLLLGATATGTNDIRPNPFDPAIDGVENHAAVIENIVTQDFLKRPLNIYEIELFVVLGIGLLFCPVLIFANSLFSGMAVILFLVGYYYMDKVFWFGEGTWTYLGIPSLQIIAMYVLSTLYKYMTEEAEKKKVKGAFQHYLSPDVIDQVLEDPESLQLGGEKKELTVFFSDVRSFTTISESLTPEKLCELMNDYFTPMTSIILRSKGVLDKYIGDAIMAFWGAPIDLPQHADVGVKASVEMLFALDQLRHDFKVKGFPEIDIGIGLNTGPMSVGNMGSGERFTYTVMGDSVNLGARLEGLTKEYGIKIMISEFTMRKLTPGAHLTRDLDDIRVKGKTEPVQVFDVLRPDFLPQPAMIQEFCQKFDEGRKLYKAQEFERAITLFSDCVKMKANDKASLLYLSRIEEYQKNRPGEDWDGVYTFTHK